MVACRAVRAGVLLAALLALSARAAAHPGAVPRALGRFDPHAPPPSRPEAFAGAGGGDGAAIAADVRSMCAGAQNVTVSWSGVSGAASKDFIAVYSPPDAEAHDYLDYVWARDAPGYESGGGNVTLLLHNLRAGYGFRYYAAGSAYELRATSPALSVCSDMPLQGRLSHTGNDTQMRLVWVSGSAAAPEVRYGASPGALAYRRTGTTRSYSAADMCGSPANTTGSRLFRPVGYIHDVLMETLQPGQTVFYRYGGADGLTDVMFFIMPEVPRASGSASFIAFGDMGAGYYVPPAAATARRVREHADAGDVTAVLHIGDISYARGHGFVWDLFGVLMGDLQVPYMLGAGNHEFDYVTSSARPGGGDPSGQPHFTPPWSNYADDSRGECGVPLSRRYHMPENGNGLFWYSFDHGPVHVAVVSCEHNFTAGSPMARWLDADLAAVDRSRTPWLLVAGHRPMYNSELNYTSDQTMALRLRAGLEPVMHRHGVDIYLAGHYHSVERTDAVFNGTVSPDGTRHFLIGSAGASLDDVPFVPSPWSLYSQSEHFAYGRFSFDYDEPTASSIMRYELHLTHDDSIADSVTLQKRV